MATASVPKKPRLSPLRYPGGKAGLFPLLRSVIRSNLTPRCNYVEPYAGGAGAALALLIHGEVSAIVINDLDPNINAFWHAVIYENEWFVEAISQVDLSIEEWRRQREVLRHPASVSLRDLGFATFYLNRTNRSGVLNGGPIGGLNQQDSYSISARFNRSNLVDRCRLIGRFAPRITIRSSNGKEVIAEFKTDRSSFIYADPPYFEKAPGLYLNSFTLADHTDLAEVLNCAAESFWLLTYDDVGQVHELYCDRRIARYPLHYSAHSPRNVFELMIVSDALNVHDPAILQLFPSFG